MSEFKIGDLVWAKMRGFPHWPAQIAKTPTTSNPKYSVIFFGTQESGFVKSSDIADYYTHLDVYGTPRQLNGFQTALEEIREAANKNDTKISNLTPKKDSTTTAVPVVSPNSGRLQRNRVPNRLIANNDFVVPQTRRKAPLPDPIKDEVSASEEFKEPQPLLSAATLRKRTDSTSSTERSRKRLFSDKFGVDLSDIEPTFSNAHKLLSNGGLSLFEGIDSEQSEDDVAKSLDAGRSRRRTRSRLLDEYLYGSTFLKSPRDRSGSLSSTNGRKRLISGFSDTFDGLAEVFNPQEFVQAIDDLPSEESDRPITPDELNAANSSQEHQCYSCKSRCEIKKRKWKCTNNQCKLWNGAVDNQLAKKPHPLSLNSWDRPLLSDLPVSDSSMNDPITTLASEAMNSFVADPTPLSTSEVPVATSSGDEAALDKIKEYLLNENERREVEERTRSSSKNAKVTSVLSDSKIAVQVKNELKEPLFDPSFPGTTEFPDPTQHTMESMTEIQRPEIPSGVRMEQYYAPKRTMKSGVRSKGVENTPPVSTDGVRYCYFCPGQVRPQMCGGNKHRWRCVDKKCRKWYGWVKSNDVIPRDLGKKGRWKDLVIRVQSSTNEFEDRLASDMIGNTGNEESKSSTMEHDPTMRNKRRYKRKGPSNRDVSPLTIKEAYFEPSCMEQRSRWWINERRRNEYSPERNIGTNSIADAAAALRMMGNSMLMAAGTKSDECGAINGTLDLMLDSLLSSMAPLLTLTKYMPGAEPPQEALQRIWNSNSLHLPLF
ncbi:PWWP domain-containing protein [Aphelenchoides besseyi]|nr:PWWP domain-containing protein [Aphelenchoides besseyi]KAI6208397.1 PWWP domain-containing protein [Aphelenchoides besseyi]